MTRRRLYEIIEATDDTDHLGRAYDSCMIVLIVMSIIPLAFKEQVGALDVIDKGCAFIFTLDYLARWVTADFRFEQSPQAIAYIRYPFSAFAIIDLLSILPSFMPVNQGLKVLRLFRMARALRVLRVFKALRYSRSIRIISQVVKASRDSLIAVCSLAVGYILVSALVIFNVEPDSFATFFDAVYWATVSLTTVGYGDIYPITTTGRIITMVSSIFGIAIVALPAGIITAGYLQVLEKGDAAES